MKDKYLRALADMENVRHRAEVQVKHAKEFGTQKFCKDLISVADVFQLAIKSCPTDMNSEGEDGKGEDARVVLKGLYDGLIMTEKNLQKAFQANGLVEFNPHGEKFDPNLHEAVFEMDDPKMEPMHVGVVTKTGYQLHGRVLRAATVGVVRKR